MKSLQELINKDDSAWHLVKEWIAEAVNPVEVLLPVNDATRADSLFAVQVTTRSTMGAIIYETGGILVDKGWLRILGSGHPRLPRSVANWNMGRSFSAPGEQPPFLLIADDVVGGFFALDGGGLGLETGKVCYFAPDRLEWENTGKGYSDFLVWCFSGDLAGYYETIRWPGWQDEIQGVNGSQAFSFYPFLSCAGPPIPQRGRRPVNMAEIYDLHVEKRA